MRENHFFIYYGVKIDKVDFERLSNKSDMSGFYNSVMSHGLRFRECGEIGKTWEFVIGREIYWSINKMITPFEIKDGNIIIEGEKLVLGNEDEIREKLLDLDIKGEPQYLIFSCWRDLDDN